MGIGCGSITAVGEVGGTCGVGHLVVRVRKSHLGGRTGFRRRPRSSRGPGSDVPSDFMDTIWLTGAQWLAVLRIGLGLWWLESWRHKDKNAWFHKGSGIAWAQSVADKHKWPFVRNGFNKVVKPRPKQMAYVVVFSELAIG